MEITDVMSFYIFLSVLLVCGAILVFRKLIAARRRRNLLVQGGRVSTWQDIESRPERFVRLIRTDFGYGREVWALTTKTDQIDRQLRAFKSGILISPRPKPSE